MELKRLAQLEHNNCGETHKMRPKYCVFDSRNCRIIMGYNNKTPYSLSPIRHGKNGGKSRFYSLIGYKNLSSPIFSRVFLHTTTRVGQKFAMRPQFVQNAQPQDECIQLVPGASKIKPFGTQEERSNCHVPAY